MIAEAAVYLATLPVTGKTHRPFIRYSVNLWSRSRRCSASWAEHEQNSRHAVLDAMSGLRQRRTAVVLGSGLLRDIPIEALVESFDTVVLIDLVHLAPVRLWVKLKGYRNVRFVERDLSGYDDFKANGDLEPLGFLRRVPYLDFVVSANLLSQVGRGIVARIEGEAPDAAPKDTAGTLVQAHIDGLSSLPCRACLVTDISYTVIDRTGKTHEEADLLLGAAPPLAGNRWTWPVAPLGEESRDYQIVHDVIATTFGA
jgi:hypothetical protein